VTVWVQAEDGDTVPVAIDRRTFFDFVAARGAENLIGSRVRFERRSDGSGDGASFRFDDGRERAATLDERTRP